MTSIRTADSPSSISTYNKCQRKYFLNYLVPESESPRPTVQSAEALMGTAVHSIAERCSIAWANQNDSAVTSEIRNDIGRTLEEEILNNEVISPKAHRNEDWAHIRARECAANFGDWFYRNVVKWDDWAQMMEDCKVPKEDRLYAWKDTRTIRAEFPVRKDGDKGTSNMGGVVDLVIETDKVIRIIDFKTGARPFRGYKGSDVSKQLGLYAMAYPNPQGKRIFTSAVYLACDPKVASFEKMPQWLPVEQRYIHYTVYNQEYTKGRATSIKRYLNKFHKDVAAETTWEAKPSTLCHWCPFSRLNRKNKRYCSEGNTQVNSPSRRMPRRGK